MNGQQNIELINAAEATENKTTQQTENTNEDLLFSFSWRRVGGYFGVILAMFLLVVVPVWWESGEITEQRDAAQRELRLSQMQNTLATAVIEAQRGEYEPARQTLNEFFNLLESQINAQGSSGLLETQRENLRPLLAQREELLEQLARSDHAAVERLQNLFVSYHHAINNTNQQRDL